MPLFADLIDKLADLIMNHTGLQNLQRWERTVLVAKVLETTDLARALSERRQAREADQTPLCQHCRQG